MLPFMLDETAGDSSELPFYAYVPLQICYTFHPIPVGYGWTLGHGKGEDKPLQ